MLSFLVLFAIHVYGVFIILPPPAQLLNDEPIFNHDFPVHFYQAYTTRRYLLRSGRTWGYDPYYMAGYPGNTIYDAGYKLNNIFVFVFSPLLGLARAYKLFVLLTFLLAPPVLYGAAKKFGLSPGGCLAALGLAVFFWHLDHNFTGIPRPVSGFLMWGMFTFAFACFFAVYLVALFYAYSRRRRKSDLILLFVLGPLLPATHLFSLLIAWLPLLVIFLHYLPRRGVRYLGLVLAWTAWIFAANSFWLIPLLRFREIGLYWPTGSRPLAAMIGHYTFRAGGLRPLGLLLFFGAVGTANWRGEESVLQKVYLISGAYLLLLGLFGSRIHFLASFEPTRFIGSLKVLLLVPAAAAVWLLFRQLSSRAARVLLAAPALAFLIYLMPSTGRLCADLPPQARDFIAFLEEHTDRSARILMQNSDPENIGRYFGTHMLILPPDLPREQIGGPHYLVPKQHHFAEFKGDFIFGRHLGEWEPGRLKEYLDLYNIKWVVVWSDFARDYFQRLEGYAVEIGRLPAGRRGFTVYELSRRPDYFLAGGGTVEADYDRIRISGASTGEIIIKYHWIKTLKTDPPVPLDPVHRLSDPVPFIRLENPGYPEIVIYN